MGVQGEASEATPAGVDTPTPQSFKCEKCGVENLPGTNYCKQCGHPPVPMIQIILCECPTQSLTKTCEKCGMQPQPIPMTQFKDRLSYLQSKAEKHRNESERFGRRATVFLQLYNNSRSNVYNRKEECNCRWDSNKYCPRCDSSCGWSD